MLDEKLFQALKETAEKLADTSIFWSNEWACYRFEVLGKIFALYSDTYFTFKNSPEKNEILREQYPCIIAGYYMNKTHWNSLVLAENELTDENCMSLLLESYACVISKFSKNLFAISLSGLF